MSLRPATAALGLGVLLLAGCGGSSGASGACTVAVPGQQEVTLDLDQSAHAATIAATGRRLGMADHAVTVALATALQESHLHNLAYGDRDSLGLFQQRPSQGWGTPEQVTAPAFAARAFYQRLAAVDGWDDLPVTVAAQAVQRSAFPDAYADHEDEARALARALTGQVPAALSCSGLPARDLDREGLERAAADELGPRALTAPTGQQREASAAWLVASASRYGVSEVAVDGRRWTRESGTWAQAATGSDLSFS